MYKKMLGQFLDENRPNIKMLTTAALAHFRLKAFVAPENDEIRNAFDGLCEMTNGTENAVSIMHVAKVIGIAYTPAVGERTGNLFGVFVDTNGRAHLLANSSYTNGRVIFSRSSLSLYGVGYYSTGAAGRAGNRARAIIDFLASRGLFGGTGADANADSTRFWFDR